MARIASRSRLAFHQFPSHQTAQAFCKAVLKYHRTQGRHHLPWRKTHDPYRVLVSEIMLQQTQVDRVIPYYRAFLKQFPNARSLSRAPLSSVLRAWSGLGYNRRAKFLHEAAHTIVRMHGGSVPREYKALRALPGVGDYTAKAVRTFAFDESEVMFETNIRAALIHEFFPRSRSVSDARLEPILKEALTFIDSPRTWYAALMDYGTHIKKTHGNATRRSKTFAKQSAFKGSLRQVRGAVLRKVMQCKYMTVAELAALTGFNQRNVRRAVEALAQEGMIVKRLAVVSVA
ncbi:MAG: A/G-specific adenine glycosylase [Parcubacteria group bacterium]|nr:A/G-specific adenine glycosylase [Parcubacteria group bacterium]